MACHLRRNAFESIKTRYVPNYIREQTASTDVLKNLSGLSLCFLRIKYCLSVGAFFEHLRANIVRPYRVLDNFSAKFARPFDMLFLLGVLNVQKYWENNRLALGFCKNVLGYGIFENCF